MRLRIVNFFSVLFIALSPVANLQAQSVSAALELDTNVIVVGQQIMAKLRLTHPSNMEVSWISIPDSMEGIELINKGKIDTLATADKSKFTREQKFTITAFDSGFFVVKPFVFSYHKPGDTTTFTTETLAQLLTVNLIPVDTTKAIRDIKAPVEIGITWQEVLTYSLTGLLIIGLIILAIYFIKRKKTSAPVYVAPIPTRPAHEIAMEELEKIKEEKLWQQGNYKLYYTRLSDTLRSYISHRWGFDAMEKTTDEIMHSAFSQQLNNENFSRIKNTLVISDLAKFAKYTPISNENEQTMTDSFIFVNETKEEKREDVKNSNSTLNSNNQNQ